MLLSWIRSGLTAVAMLISTPELPAELSPDWAAPHGWTDIGKALEFRAQSVSIPAQCLSHPDWYLHTPVLIQGFHEVFLDGVLVQSSGDPSFKRASYMMNMMVIPCYQLSHGKVVEWHAIQGTRSYARIANWPEIRSTSEGKNFFYQDLPSITFGILLILAIFCGSVFFGSVDARMLGLFIAGIIFMSAHFFLTVPDLWDLRVPPRILHPFHDIMIWTGTALIWMTYARLGVISKVSQYLLAGITVVAITIILISDTLDQSQVGSSIAFVGNVLACSYSAVRSLIKKRGAEKREKPELSSILVLLFCSTGINDLLMHAGGLPTVPIYPFGVIALIIFIAIKINEQIKATYRERDQLRESLQQRVEEKTRSLKEKSESLERAYAELSMAQGELVQNAKLASIGTLSAGIAHEINNSLNYVNGSLDPLAHILTKDTLSDRDRSKAAKLLGLMKDGLSLTFDIINNLKRHVTDGGGQAEDLSVAEAVRSTLVILKSRLQNIEVKSVSLDSFEIKTFKVGFYQILMNVFTNAIDAIEEKNNETPVSGLIEITAVNDGVHKMVTIRDNGTGIKSTVKDRVFDPFFTTKIVGKGTGLGLHIVRNEMARVGGAVEISSDPGAGTAITLKFVLQNLIEDQAVQESMVDADPTGRAAA